MHGQVELAMHVPEDMYVYAICRHLSHIYIYTHMQLELSFLAYFRIARPTTKLTLKPAATFLADDSQSLKP